MFTYLCRSTWFRATAAISACSTSSGAWRSEVVATASGRSTSATLYAEPQKVRFETTSSTYITPTVIVRYDLGLLYLLIPVMQCYLDLPISVLANRSRPFRYPPLNLRKVHQELTELRGVPAIRYSARVDDGAGRKFEGSLWESSLMPGYPLMWKDAAGQMLAKWEKVEAADLPPDLFDVPANYIRI